jgi:hypothetical protein
VKAAAAVNSFLGFSLAVLALTVPAIAETAPAPLTVTTLQGRVFEDVKLLKREGDTVRFMHSGGIQSIKFSDLQELSARKLGYEEYLKETQGLEAAKAQATANAAKHKEDTHRRRRIELSRLREKQRKTLEEWHDLIVLASWEKSPDSETPNLQIKEAIGRPPSYETQDGSVGWEFACFNPTTEKMETLRIGKRHRRLELARQTVEWDELAMECGSESMELSATVRFGFRLPTEPKQPTLEVIDARILHRK